MKITVIGSGYVGLVTGACLSEVGNDVTCVDIDAAKVTQMQQGHVPIYEPGLDALFQRNKAAKRLNFTTDLAASVAAADVVFLALPTPSSADGSANLSAVYSVADSLGLLLSGYTVIVNKSTVPVGTAAEVRRRVAAHAKYEFDVVSNPEFLREGLAIEDFMKPDRVVVGTHSDKARQVMSELYAPLIDDQRPIYFMDEASSELTKYAANAFLVTKISFINEIANVCELLGADVESVSQAIGADRRIGKHFLQAGIGYGGSCFPKDIQALQRTSEDHGYNMKLLEASMKVNAQQRRSLVEKLLKYSNGDIKGKKIALWGLAFKPDTDDIREAPSLTIIESLLEAGANIVAYDPEASEHVRKLYPEDKRLVMADDLYDAIDGADALMIVTEWQAFKDADLSKVAEKLNNAVIFDGRNIYKAASVQAAKITYFSVGQQAVLAT